MENRFSQYRAVKYDRTFKTLGKMSWWRIALGIALLILVLFMAGAVSQYFAVRGNFVLAEKCMLFPGWMETYKPEAKAYFEAGAMYQRGEVEAAYEHLGGIEELDAALSLRADAAIELANGAFTAGDSDAAYDFIASVAPENVSDDARDGYNAACEKLLDAFADDADKAAVLESALSYQPEG